MFELRSKPNASVRADLFAGLTVSLAMVPEVVAFTFVAAVDPMVGLYAAFIVGFIAAIFGGRPGMVSGGAGALAVVVTALVVQHGVEYLFAAVVLMGLMQLLFGLLRMGRFIALVPYPVMLGFVNGLAIVIFLAQLQQFQTLEDGQWHWLSGTPLLLMLGLVAFAMAIIHFLPRFSRTIPASLVAILVVTALVHGFDLPTATVIDFVRNMSGNAEATLDGTLPSFNIPMVPFTWETFTIIFPYALILAAVGLLESLLTLNLVDEITETQGQPNRECVAQGAANIVSGCFGGMGGCAMIGQSIINLNSGGRSRLSGATCALSILGFILFGAHLIEMIPLAALVGVMFMVVLGTFEWASLKMIRKVPRADVIVIVLVTIVTVFTDLALAVLVGVLVSAIRFAWDQATRLTLSSKENDSTAHYQLEGVLFFASVTHFHNLFDIKTAPSQVTLDLSQARLADHSALEAIHKLSGNFAAVDKNLVLVGLTKECQARLERAGDLVQVQLGECHS
ncbi:sodium-independent anion transporter [Vibrio astriarenae]|uniref:Sodium-independent anion transporter n=1 Tax=Vibrio astriarenae TaxID=1481923 RepID=A0A7Z2T7J3_9VIBR|nr:SulP family inorganic anion transporter [Vibrio astriarenae]QIA65678.1 sodium-independent anion transporter [Vibrio astriarenae]